MRSMRTCVPPVFLPLRIDDPKSKGAISDLVISLFNGATGATMKHGEKHPHQWLLFLPTSLHWSRISKEVLLRL